MSRTHKVNDYKSYQRRKDKKAWEHSLWKKLTWKHELKHWFERKFMERRRKAKDAYVE